MKSMSQARIVECSAQVKFSVQQTTYTDWSCEAAETQLENANITMYVFQTCLIRKYFLTAKTTSPSLIVGSAREG